MIVAFTGHRPNKLGGYNDNTNLHEKVIKEVRFMLIPYEVTYIISGMALGVDTWVAWYAVSNLIPFAAYVPFYGQETMWPTDSQSIYKGLLNKAHKVKYICDPGYAAWKMQKRNEAMVNDCNLLVAIWDGSKGGTGNCVSYAKKVNKEILRINPTEL